MILDQDTNIIYISKALKKSHGKVHHSLRQVMKEFAISMPELDCDNIWCRDYMPIQVNDSKYVKFTYKPSYNPESKDIKNLEIPGMIKSNLVIDGGNVIKGKNQVILTDKVLTDNNSMLSKNVIKELENLFECRVVIVPREPFDIICHADGMLRFISNETIIVNDYNSIGESDYMKDLFETLNQIGFDVIPVPFVRPKFRINEMRKRHPEAFEPATGYYINYLHVRNVIVIPTFGLTQDDEFYKKIESIYPHCYIRAIDCSYLAEEGGVLNCITATYKI